MERTCGGRRPHVLRSESGGNVATDGASSRQDSERSEADGSPHRTAHEVRARDQPQDRQGPWPDDPAVAPAAGGSGDRVIDRRAFITSMTGALLAAPPAAEAQHPANVPRIAVLSATAASARQETFRPALLEI